MPNPNWACVAMKGAAPVYFFFLAFLPPLADASSSPSFPNAALARFFPRGVLAYQACEDTIKHRNKLNEKKQGWQKMWSPMVALHIVGLWMHARWALHIYIISSDGHAGSISDNPVPYMILPGQFNQGIAWLNDHLVKLDK